MFTQITYDFWPEWRLDLALLQRLPVDLVVEERVDENRLLAAVRHHTAQTPRRLLGHELQQQDQQRAIVIILSIETKIG